MKYQNVKNKEIVEALQWTGDNIAEMIGLHRYIVWTDDQELRDEEYPNIKTIGIMRSDENGEDYIEQIPMRYFLIKDKKGDLEIMSQKKFKKTYNNI